MRWLIFNLILVSALPASARASSKPAPATVSTCFTPGPESCAEQIVDLIDEAHASVRVQAYYLTQPLILRAIATAKRRGLDVAVILDKSQDRRNGAGSRYSGATYLASAGVPVWIDDAPAIAHSKVIILDDRRMREPPYDRALALAAQVQTMRDHFLDVSCGCGARRVIALGVMARDWKLATATLAHVALRLGCTDCRTGPDEVHLCATIYGRVPAPLGGGDCVWTLPLVERGHQPSYWQRRPKWG